MPPPLVVAEARDLIAMADRVNGTQQEPPVRADEALGLLNVCIAMTWRTVNERKRVLPSLRQAVDDFSATIELPLLAGEWERANEALAAAQRVVQAAEEGELVSKRRQQELRDEAQLTDARLERLFRRRKLQAELRAAETAFRLASERTRQAESSLAQAEGVYGQMRAALDSLAKANEATEVLRRDEVALQHLIPRVHQVQQRLLAVANEREGLPELSEICDRENQNAERLMAEHEEAAMRAFDADKLVKELTVEAEARARLVAELVGHLHKDDKQCPVCATEFREGELLERATKLVADNDPRLRAATEEASRWHAIRRAKFDALEAARTAAASLNRREADVKRRVAEADEEAAELERHPFAAGRPLDQLERWFGERLAAIRSKIEALGEERRRLDGDGTLARTANVAAQEITRWREELEVSRQHQAAVERDQRAMLLARDADGLKALDGRELDSAIDEQEKRRAQVKDALASAAGNVLEAENALARARDQLAGASRLRHERELALAAAQSKRGAAIESWRGAGQPEVPSQAGLDRFADQLARAEGIATELQQRHSALALHYKRWLESEDIQRLHAEIQRVLTRTGAASAEECETRLTERIRDLERGQRAWQKARTLTDTVEQRIRADHEKFVDQVISPLQSRVEAFDLAWSAFPDLQLDLRFRQYRAAQKLDFSINGHDAALILSEGQSGVKSLSYLLSASTAYPWSRWRALLLDDPLQYNDLVHKTAFLDVLRALVIEENYQVILSTHDMEEAQFIARKCRNAGIAFRLCRLLGPGENGVEFAVS